MLKSLYSGVSGLQSHQIAMDVESNNIANVNTTGFKYSRANFSNILAQTSAIATAPQGQLGGKNPVQVGLGTTVNSTTTIYAQGSIQNTDKNTDVAIQGDGFFIVSSDGGRTNKYTRAGDFKFDAAGNFVDNNGFIVQGYLKDPATGKVDSSGSPEDIVIDPGLTTPANPTGSVVLKANLNSGALVNSFAAAYAVDDTGTVKGGAPSGDIGVMFGSTGEAFSLQEGEGVEISFDGGTTKSNYSYTSDAALVTTAAGADKVFHSMADLREAMDNEASAAAGTNVSVTVDETGQFKIENSDAAGNDLQIQVKAIDGIVENTKFTTSMKALESTVTAGSGVTYSQSFNAATHSSSIDIFDSLGSKHTLRTEFRKTSSSEWAIKFSVPSPGTLNTYEGKISFNSDGSLQKSPVPSNLLFTGNNGSKPDQKVDLNFGTTGQFDGITSFDSPSSTSGISQDGFTGGDLVGIRIDQSGTLIGSFSNGRSFGLAQIGMAKFTNNEGLSTEGGNVYNQTANSGEPIIGTAATGGRGFIQASSLEASNVDLSKSLTNLIIIQRGYEANGKTITTSDEMLQTLLGLKR